jgi:hypothetical protein
MNTSAIGRVEAAAPSPVGAPSTAAGLGVPADTPPPLLPRAAAGSTPGRRRDVVHLAAARHQDGASGAVGCLGEGAASLASSPAGRERLS